MSPGTYLRKRREAAGLTLADVAAALATEPRWSEIDRLAWLTAIERDVSPLALLDGSALMRVFPFDQTVLTHLQLGPPGLETPRFMLCQECACSAFDACRGDGPACHWAAPGLCSRCADRLTETPAPAPLPVDEGEKL